MKKYAKVLLTSAVILASLAFSVLSCSALAKNAELYNPNFKESSSPAKTLAAVAEAQYGKLSADLGYNNNYGWSAYFIGDCARLAGIPNEIIPHNIRDWDDMYQTLTKKLGAKAVDKNNAQPGDLVFYLGISGKMWHCGIYVGDGIITEGWLRDYEKNTVGVWHREIGDMYLYRDYYFIRPDYASLSKKFSVSFDEESAGIKLEKITKKYGETVYLPDTVPSREGKYFAGWSKTPNGKIEYLPRAPYKKNESVLLYAIFKDSAPVRYDKPLTGGNAVFGIDEMMYPGDIGTQYHNAIAKSSVWSPASGQYERFFGIDMEETVYGGVECVKVSLIENFASGYFDFNYYQHNCGYYMPSLDCSKYKYLKIIYAYNNAASNVDYMKFWASKDVYPQNSPLKSAYKTFKINNGYGQWQSALIDISTLRFQDSKTWGESTVRQFRLHMFEGNQNPDAEFYIAGFAFFESEEEASKWNLTEGKFAASYREYTDHKLESGQYSEPLTGGIRLFGVKEMMYEGDKDTQFHNAFAKSDVKNPINGRYENYFGTKMEKKKYKSRDSVKVSLINSRTDGYLDFNYYQWDSKYYEPSLDGSKYKYLVINYCYPNKNYIPAAIKVWASKDVVPLGTNILKTGSVEQKIDAKSNKWGQVVIDLSDLKFTDGTTWSESTIRQWRLHFFEGNKSKNACVYISSLGFFESEKEALEWDGKTEAK